VISKTTETEGAKSLLTARAVREASQRMLALALDGSVQEWSVDLEKLPETAEYVERLTRERFPRLNVPMHSRWRHFVFGGRDLWREIVTSRTWPNPAARARAAFDLAITSVLLDAGAGAAWRYMDPETEVIVSRSEGLAFASLRWFEGGGLSSEKADPLRADASALQRVDARSMRRAFQITETNLLTGANERAALLNRLGAAVEARPDLFALQDTPRPGGLFDVFARRAVAKELTGAVILETLLEALGPIWTGRPQLAGVSLGDCWPHPTFGSDADPTGYVPLHKLSQWLAYSLIEPLQEAGFAVPGIDALTGLPEYRNGGLLIDMGVLVPRNPAQLRETHAVSSPFVVGMRALTVALLDRLAPAVGIRLGLPQDSLLLARVLEGGTWAAGRAIARSKREGGGPPLQISSDGTVL
jgi:hypothetical protein